MLKAIKPQSSLQPRSSVLFHMISSMYVTNHVWYTPVFRTPIDQFIAMAYGVFSVSTISVSPSGYCGFNTYT